MKKNIDIKSSVSDNYLENDNKCEDEVVTNPGVEKENNLGDTDNKKFQV
jgi:hypothetical protein